jgi:hypothetical protein
MKYLLVRLYKGCFNKSPGVKIGPAPGVIDFIYVYSKNLKNLLLKNPKS